MTFLLFFVWICDIHKISDLNAPPNITYLGKIPNDMQSYKKFEEMKDVLYKEIACLFPKYSFSHLERYKHWVKIEGTKIR